MPPRPKKHRDIGCEYHYSVIVIGAYCRTDTDMITLTLGYCPE